MGAVVVVLDAGDKHSLRRYMPTYVSSTIKLKVKERCFRGRLCALVDDEMTGWRVEGVDISRRERRGRRQDECSVSAS